MRTFFQALTVLLALPAMAAAAEREERAPAVQQVSPPPGDAPFTADPLALYGGDLVFDVFRKGRRVGEHHVSFRREGERLTVEARFNLRVNVFVFNYTFDYESTEIWDGNELTAVTANVDDNGKHTAVNAVTEGGLFKVASTRRDVHRDAVASHWVFPTNHWNRGQASASSILNTLNGRLNTVEVVRRGIETVQTQQGPVQAEHFEYTGDLKDTEAWYDAEGRWVAMRFKAKDGSIIEHVCRQCGHGPAGGHVGGAP